MRAAPCPVAANITDSSSARARGMLGGEPPFVHDQHPVGHAEHLRQLAGDHEHGDAVAGQRATAAGAPRPWCRRRCRGSARRRSAPAARSTATWRGRPSAGCRRTGSTTGSLEPGRLHLQPLRPGAAPRGVRHRPRSRPRRLSDQRRGRVALRSTDSSMTRPCWRRSSGTRASPAAIAAAALPLARRSAVDQDLARVVPVDAEHGPDHLAAPGADQPGQGDDLAAAHGEADVGEDAGLVSPRDLQPGLAGRRGVRLRIHRGDLPADHAPHHLVDGQVGGGVGGDPPRRRA